MTVIHRHADTTATPTTENTQTGTTAGPPRAGPAPDRLRADLPVGLLRQAAGPGLPHRLRPGRHPRPLRRRRLDQRRQPHRGLPQVRRRRPVQGLLQQHRRHRLGRHPVHAGPPRHRPRPHPGHRDARRRRGRLRPLRDDVDRRPASREPPGPRRAHPRRDQHGRPRRLLRRRHVGPRQALGRHQAGQGQPPSSGSPTPRGNAARATRGQRPPDFGPGAVCCAHSPATSYESRPRHLDSYDVRDLLSPARSTPPRPACPRGA